MKNLAKVCASHFPCKDSSYFKDIAIFITMQSNKQLSSQLNITVAECVILDVAKREDPHPTKKNKLFE